MADSSGWKPPKPSSDSPIWRYLDFYQFFSLLERGALYFNRADKFSDPFEGSIPRLNVEGRSEFFRDIGLELSEKQIQILDKELSPGFFRMVRFFTFVNCWCSHDHESEAMWNLFLSGNNGLLIRSTVGRYESAIEWPEEADNSGVSAVKYINYGSGPRSTWDQIPQFSPIAQFFHKQKSFEYEHEFRGVIQGQSTMPDMNNVSGDAGLYIAESQALSEKFVPADIDELIAAIRIAPTASDDFRNVVKDTISTFSHDIPLESSEGDNVPRF